MSTNFRWVGLKEAAGNAGVAVATMYRWCWRGLVRGRRLACGRGPWRIAIGEDGLPIDGKCR